MKRLLTYSFLILMLFSSGTITAQQDDKTYEKKVSPLYIIRGSVRESNTYKPISKVNIEVNGGAYTMTSIDGAFMIRARKGDELVIRHKDFETVYYTIIDDDRITVEVEPATRQKQSNSKFKEDINTFNALVDSIIKYKKQDVSKSIEFAGEALSQSTSQRQNAEAYMVLAEVYMHWKQYDLAVTNYRVSLQNKESNEAKLGLAKAYERHKNYQESIDTYKAIDKKQLSNYQLVSLYEGLGDTYFSIKNYESSINAYKKGLEIANTHLIKPKVVD
jgi:two-component system LytT family sensor kinase